MLYTLLCTASNGVHVYLYHRPLHRILVPVPVPCLVIVQAPPSAAPLRPRRQMRKLSAVFPIIRGAP